MVFPKFAFQGKYFPRSKKKHFPRDSLLFFFSFSNRGERRRNERLFEEQKFLSNGIERELLLGEDEQSEKRKIGAAICSRNRPFLPAFPFKKIILVSQHRVSFQDCPPLSSFLFMNYRGRKLGPKRGKRFCFCLQRKIYARKSQKSSSRGRDPKFHENNFRPGFLSSFQWNRS